MLHKNKYVTTLINYIKMDKLITLKYIHRLHQSKIHKLTLT